MGKGFSLEFGISVHLVEYLGFNYMFKKHILYLSTNSHLLENSLNFV